jgi:hypothetical protein
MAYFKELYKSGYIRTGNDFIISKTGLLNKILQFSFIT